jgi:hypothetical protein
MPSPLIGIKWELISDCTDNPTWNPVPPLQVASIYSIVNRCVLEGPGQCRIPGVNVASA